MRADTHRSAFAADERGAVAIITVLVIGVVFAMAALSIDVSQFYLAKRQQQMVTDLAAVAAAANLGNARAAALANLAANGLPASELVSVDLGTYSANASVPASQRFVAGSGSSANAARITLQSHPGSFFASALGPVAAEAPTLSTTSVAENANTADFTLGSSLASFDGGLANAILGGLTGSHVALSALDYQNLASANVDLFGLAAALAARTGAGNVTLSALAATPVHLSDLVAAAADAGSAAGLSSANVAALRNLATAFGSSGPSVTLGALVNPSVYAGFKVNSPAPLAAPVPVLSLITAAARASAGSGEIQVTLATTGPVILGATVKIVLGASPAGGTFAGLGPTGTTLATAQSRVLLTVQLAGAGVVPGLSLPLIVDVAPATSRIATLSCVAGKPVDPPATLGVTPGVVDAWVGTVSDAGLADLTTKLNPAPAALTSLGTVAVSGQAQASIANRSETQVAFSLADIAAHNRKTVSTTDYTSSLLSQLFGSIELSATLLGKKTALPIGTAAAVAQILQKALQPVDLELSNTLAMLGVTLGNATSTVGGVRCGGGMLVN